MTAKELRQAAEVLAQASNNYLKSGLLSTDCTAVVSMARHILSTVRDDDDEQWSAEWAFSLCPESVNGNCDEEYLTLYLLGEFGVEWSIVVPVPKTRGQFRSLCRGLGIVLKEKTTC